MKSSTTRREKPARAENKKKQPPKDSSKDSLWEWIKSLGIAFILFMVVRTFLIQAYTIPSGSMENSLLIGDYLMANNAIYGAKIPLTDWRMPAFREPQHGDIVVFRPDYNEPVIDVVKRVIGEPGDTIQMIDRVVYRNGERLEEPYVEPNYTPNQPLQRYGPAGYDWHFSALPETVDPTTYQPTRDSWGPLIVPPDKYLLLGDNRDESLDSRYMGFIDREVISGKAMFIYYSVNEEIERPFPRFITAARWGRIGHVIR